MSLLDVDSIDYIGVNILFKHVYVGIFDDLDLDILVRVAKMISPRKMAPILAAMNTPRAQELTVRLASETSENPEQMQAADLAALPQIVGQ